MKLRILLLVVAGTAGLGSSYALANGGNGHHHFSAQTTTSSCQRAGVLGTSGPQTFTVTVTKAGGQSSLAPGQVITVTVGSSGQTLRFTAAGCLNGSSLSARSALLFAPLTMPTTTTGTTTTGHTITDKDNGRRHGHGKPGGTTTTSTTTATTTAGTTTTGGTSHAVKPFHGGGRHGRHGRHG